MYAWPKLRIGLRSDTWMVIKTKGNGLSGNFI